MNHLMMKKNLSWNLPLPHLQLTPETNQQLIKRLLPPGVLHLLILKSLLYPLLALSRCLLEYLFHQLLQKRLLLQLVPKQHLWRLLSIQLL